MGTSLAMIVLVANLGSTSFKYKLFDMPDSPHEPERVLATGSAERIGQGGGAWSIDAGDQRDAGQADLPDHAAAIELHLDRLTARGAIESIDAVEAIGFKAVHGGPISGAVRVDDDVLATMERFSPLAPAHNPPYIAAMRSFRQRLPRVAQVAAFETAFHQTIPLARQVYAIPHDWTERLGVRRYGFHGASHRYIAERMAKLAPKKHKVISLHLGGSCSICAIDAGDSVATSMGTTPQSGVFHNNRVGDFDAFALRTILREEPDLDRVFDRLGREGGLLGISGVSADLREVERAADGGDERARLAIDAFVESCRHYLGAYLAVLSGADAIVFTGGIGQHAARVREAICADMDYAGIVLDRWRNRDADGDRERRLDADESRTQVWIVPTNEELVVARQTVEVLQQSHV